MQLSFCNNIYGDTINKLVFLQHVSNKRSILNLLSNLISLFITREILKEQSKKAD